MKNSNTYRSSEIDHGLHVFLLGLWWKTIQVVVDLVKAILFCLALLLQFLLCLFEKLLDSLKLRLVLRCLVLDYAMSQRRTRLGLRAGDTDNSLRKQRT